jgi:hypothetical protein
MASALVGTEAGASKQGTGERWRWRLRTCLGLAHPLLAECQSTGPSSSRQILELMHPCGCAARYIRAKGLREPDSLRELWGTDDSPLGSSRSREQAPPHGPRGGLSSAMEPSYIANQDSETNL